MKSPSATRADGAGQTATRSVGVVIPTFNHAQFLCAALDSVMAQTRPADEIVVVDDGSTDDPGSVVGRYPKARLLRQENAGLSAARNAGLASISANYVLFLDADDMLCPRAIACNLALFGEQPGAGFVYGAYNRVDADCRVLLGPCYIPVGIDPIATFYRGNAVGMHATVLYDCAKLRQTGSFDPALRSCEDYDVYLRMAKLFPVASHGEVVALYRTHDQNMSADPARMLRSALAVHRRHQPSAGDSSYFRHWRAGRRHWKRIYADAAFDGRWGTDEGGPISPF